MTSHSATNLLSSLLVFGREEHDSLPIFAFARARGVRNTLFSMNTALTMRAHWLRRLASTDQFTIHAHGRSATQRQNGKGAIASLYWTLTVPLVRVNHAGPGVFIGIPTARK